jgi:hypothetical protein
VVGADAGAFTITNPNATTLVTAAGTNTVTSLGAGTVTVDLNTNAGTTLNVGTSGTPSTGNIIVTNDATTATITATNSTGTLTINGAGAVAQAVTAGTGNVTINSELGTTGDTYTVTGLTTAGQTFTGTNTTGHVTIFDVTAGAGAQTITTGSGADIITGGAGADVINGGVGNDEYNYSTATGDTGVAAGTTGAISTTALDVITVTAGDTIDLAASLGTQAGYDTVTRYTAASASALTVAAGSANTGTVVITTGVYDSTAKTFTPGNSTPNAELLSWASADATTADQSIILVGTASGTDTIADGILTIV